MIKTQIEKIDSITERENIGAEEGRGSDLGKRRFDTTGKVDILLPG